MNTLPISLGIDFESYVASVKQIPHLTPEEEYDLAVDYYENQSLEAAHKLVLPHLFYVVKIARSFSGYGISTEDLVQEGNIGLMKSVKSFNPYLGFKFVSYAALKIKGEIWQFILDNWKIVRIATTKAQRKLFFNLRGFLKENTLSISDEKANEIAQTLNVKSSDVKDMSVRLFSNDVSYATTDYYDDEYTDCSNLVIADDSPAIEDTLDCPYKKVNFEEALANLNKKEQDIIKARWLTVEKPTPLRELAGKYGVSIEAIRQTETKAIQKLRKMLVK